MAALEIFSQLTVVIGRLGPDSVQMLGTGFLISHDGKVATTHHVIGNQQTNLIVIPSKGLPPGQFQNLADKQVQYLPATVAEIDPTRDLAIIQVPGFGWNGPLPMRGNVDEIRVASRLDIYGYPHCVHGRRAFTFQSVEVGAKVLQETHGIPSKHAVINAQARPGQSGSPAVDPRNNAIVGILAGAWVPGPTGIRLGDIDPYELHQTTHCISAGHLWEML
ncbi:MAG: serine protease [Ramlibacter sp.]|nr:serine protease [Ramlibacter sp.]